MIDYKAPPLVADYLPPANIEPTPRLRLIFNALGLLAVVAATLLPLTYGVYWLSASADELAMAIGVARGTVRELGMPLRIGSLLVGIVPLIVLVWGLLRVRNCFAEFAEGRLFSVRGLSGLRDFAIGIGASVLVKIVTTAALSVMLSWSAPAGQRQLAIQISSDTVLFLLFAATMASVVWAMRAAAVIAEDHSLIV